MKIATDLLPVVKTFCEELIPYAAEVIGMTPRELKNLLSNVTVATIDESPTVNGWVKFNGKYFHININATLMCYFSHMSIFYATKLGIDHSASFVPNAKYPWLTKIFLNRYSPAESNFSNEEVFNIAKKLLETFWKRDILNFDSQGLFNRLQPFQKHMASAFVESMLRFTVSHEISHMLIQLLEQNFSKNVNDALKIGNGFAEMYTKSYFKLPEHDLKALPDVKTKEEVIFNWGKEFAADIIGGTLCANFNRKSWEAQNVQYWSIELMFILLLMLEKYYKKIYKKLPFFNSHPFSEYRLAVVRIIAAKSNRPEIFQLGDLWIKECDNILCHI